MLESCKHSSMMLLNLINDLLDLAKQERQTFQLNKSFFNLTRTVMNTFKTLEFLSMKKDIQTKLTIDPEQARYFECIYGDSNRFE
mmetsp:Transcript_11879/g.18354  ORF Transcript_11879/g.18354 Transcript_11879/m.18354 type:complete len:85 (+) Transcript_11879:2202-2456(+)